MSRHPAGTETWIPRDGDAILTKEDFIFYVIGYLHRPESVFSYIKYVPKKLAKEFNIKWLPYEWKMIETELVRPAKLYSPDNYEEIVNAFRKTYPDYVFDDSKLRKALIAIPKTSIKKVFEPSTSLTRLLKKKKDELDELERSAVELIGLLSDYSKLPLESFGIHGSISLGIQNPESDIDIAVYGARNFRKVIYNLNELTSKNDDFSRLEETIFDVMRRNRFMWKGRRAVVNATRTYEEMTERFGDLNYIATDRHLSFISRVTEDEESVFRPAVYGISGYRPLDANSEIDRRMEPSQVVSMIGELRGIASKGEEIKVSGSLEKVENAKMGRLSHFRVVVGSAERKPQDEFITVTSRRQS
jgi:predicted nucleotidyltransferase